MKYKLTIVMYPKGITSLVVNTIYFLSFIFLLELLCITHLAVCNFWSRRSVQMKHANPVQNDNDKSIFMKLHIPLSSLSVIKLPTYHVFIPSLFSKEHLFTKLVFVLISFLLTFRRPNIAIVIYSSYFRNVYILLSIYMYVICYCYYS